MKIEEMNENDLLDFLMTSDFESDYSPKEFRYLLTKFRYFYRMLNGKSERNYDYLVSEVNRLNIENSDLNSKIDEINQNLIYKDNMISILQNRKLTWRERITGKLK